MELTRSKVIRYNPSFLTKFIYRTFDIMIGFIGCIITLFLCLFIKLIYLKADDHFPIIFKQERIGQNGELFQMYKIRSMVPNADEILFELMENNEDIKKEYIENKKLEKDPRITDIGHKIRRTSLDEFPQFFNVLKGDMTLVGPRPYLPRERKDMGDTYEYIIQCKPAITGPWQIGGRNKINFHDRCYIDVSYVKNKKLSVDIRIFIRTITSVIKKHGAK